VFGPLFSSSRAIKKETRSRQIGCTCYQEMSPYTSRKLCDVQTHTSQRSSTAQQYVLSCWNQRSHGRYQYGVTLRVKNSVTTRTLVRCHSNQNASLIFEKVRWHRQPISCTIYSLMLLSNSDVVSNAIHKDHLHFKTAYSV
jgi:hypothetical protein